MNSWMGHAFAYTSGTDFDGKWWGWWCSCQRANGVWYSRQDSRLAVWKHLEEVTGVSWR